MPVQGPSGTYGAAVSGFRTARLRAEPLSLVDVEFFKRLWGDERVGAMLGGVRDACRVRAVVAEGVDHWERHGFGRWVLHSDRGPVGTVKLACWQGRGRPEVELGYALVPEFWGCGYATEAGAGALAFAAGLGLPEVVAFTLPSNTASLEVMGRLGFGGDERVVLSRCEHVLLSRRLVG